MNYVPSDNSLFTPLSYVTRSQYTHYTHVFYIQCAYGIFILVRVCERFIADLETYLT